MTPQDFFNRMQTMDVGSLAKQLAGQYAPPAGSLFTRTTGPTQGQNFNFLLPTMGGAGGTAQTPTSSGGLPGPAVSPPPVVNTPAPAAPAAGGITPQIAQALQQYIQQQMGLQRMGAALGFKPSYLTGLPNQQTSLAKILGLG